MGVSRRIAGLCAAALSAGAALTTASPADGAASGFQAGADHAITASPDAQVTDIREVVNQRAQEVQVFKGEDRAQFPVPAKGRWIGSMWIPWVGGESEMGKSITISWGGRVHYRVFQDYASVWDQVRYTTANSYAKSSPVPGSSTGAGRKRLTIRGDGSLLMEKSG